MYKNFAVLLDKTNKTAYQVAKDTGISTATLSNWKNGNYIPKVDKLKILADYFGVSIEYFLEQKARQERHGDFIRDITVFNHCSVSKDDLEEIYRKWKKEEAESSMKKEMRPLPCKYEQVKAKEKRS